MVQKGVKINLNYYSIDMNHYRYRYFSQRIKHCLITGQLTDFRLVKSRNCHNSFLPSDTSCVHPLPPRRHPRHTGIRGHHRGHYSPSSARVLDLPASRGSYVTIANLDNSLQSRVGDNTRCCRFPALAASKLQQVLQQAVNKHIIIYSFNICTISK